MRASISFFFYVFTAVLPSAVLAQEFSIRKVELSSGVVTLHYDLVDTTKGHTYSMRLYSSLDGYTKPLQKVSGDVGLEVVPGVNKAIRWMIGEELGPTFKGDLDLEVRGRVYIPFIRFEGFEDVKVIKRSTPRVVTWTGGSRQNVLNFNLYNSNNERVWTHTGVANDPHRVEIVLPRNVKTGKGYYFRVSDSKNADQEVRTPAFRVKAKYPLWMKVGPVVVIGTFLAIDPFKWFEPDVDDVKTPPASPGENKN